LTGYLIGNEDSPHSGSNYYIDVLIAIVPGDYTGQGLGVIRVLQNTGALHIPVAVTS